VIDRTIDRYQVIAELGRGGMGVVYKARDTLLSRLVALKVLPPEKLGDPERRERFIREAKAASALNHPGIVAVHDVLHAGGQDVIVMELVEGETLEELLARGRLPPGKALDYAIRLADALARAHAAGIVHRDLKPANVMVSRDGDLKILDFGLAKLTEAPFPDETARTVTRDRTRLTEARVIVGTVAYMSPEQASGLPVDARSDLFSFGLILYEMLTGKHPLAGGSMAETLEAIRDPHPELPSRRLASLPPEIDRVVLRCLRKEPRDRWQSLSDLKAVLEDIKEDSDSGRRVVVAGAPRKPRTWGWVAGAAAVLLVLVLAVVAAYLWRGPSGRRPLELHRLTYDGGLSALPAISADGKLVAYASDRGGEGHMDIWVRHINQPTPARLTHHPADDWMSSFSPDGSQVVFHSRRDGGGLYIVNLLGGEERRLVAGGTLPLFSPDGTQIVYLEDPDTAPGSLLRMFLVSPDGGAPRQFLPEHGTSAPPGSTGPIWSPDGKRLLFKGAPLKEPGRLDWWIAPVAGGEPVSSGGMRSIGALDVVQFPCAWLPGRVLVLAGTTIEGINLYEAAISPEGRISGPARPLTSGPGITWRPAVSTGGRIALSRFRWVVSLWEIPLDPGTGRAAGEPRRVSSGAAPSLSFSLTRDDSRLAYSTYSGSPRQRRSEILLRDLASGGETRFLSLPETVLFLEPCLSPDGSLLAWSRFMEGRRVALVGPADAAESAREVCEDCVVLGFFSGGAEVLVWRSPHRMARRQLDGGRETPVLEIEEGAILDADLSWDDRRIAVLIRSPEGGNELHILPVDDTPVRLAEGVRFDDGRSWIGPARWSPDSRLLYYLSEKDDFVCLWAQPLDPGSAEAAGEPFAVVHAHDSAMKMSVPRKRGYTLSVGRGRLIFNAGEMSGEIYTAMLGDK
jgi:Tol biopolymer transport system component/predicted Ser/Thr protein kinase